LYSDEELEQIRRIAELSDKGINYAGVREIFEITDGQA
jgi:DNA-binding transcriptional MerR regulator